MGLLLVLTAPIFVSLTIRRLAGWTQSCQEVWRMHLLKRPHCLLTDEGSTTSFTLTALSAPAALRRYIVSVKRSGMVGRG